MAAIVVTPANVVISSGSAKHGTAGGTITAGQPLYADASDSDGLKPCQADDVEAQADCIGIALNGASDGQPVSYAPPGATINAGGTLVVGVVYCVSATAGSFIAHAELVSDDFVTVIGVATTSALLKISLIVSGAQIP